MKLLFALIFILPLHAYSLTGKEIMTKNEEARRLKDITSKAKLLTGGGGKPVRTKEFTWWKKLSADGVHFKILTKFHAPVEVKNEGILFLEGEGDTTEILIYLPSYKKIRRVESGQQSGSFMGSEFSYADVSTPHVEDFDYKVIKEENCPAHATGKCYVIEYKPNKESVTERTGSSGGTIWIKQDNFMDVQSEINDLDGKPWKKLEATDIKEVDAKKFLSHHLKMENLKTKRFTTFIFSDVKTGDKLGDVLFTQQNLSKEK